VLGWGVFGEDLGEIWEEGEGAGGKGKPWMKKESWAGKDEQGSISWGRGRGIVRGGVDEILGDGGECGGEFGCVLGLLRRRKGESLK